MARRRMRLRLEDAPAFVVAPLVVTYLAVSDPLVGLAALPVAALGGALAFRLTRQVGLAALAAGAAPLLLPTPVDALVLAAALALVLAAEWIREPLVLASGAALALVPHPAGPTAAAFLAGVLGAWMRPGAGRPWRKDPRLLAAGAVAVLAVALWRGLPVYVALLVVALVALSQYLSRQPANYRVGQTFLSAGVFLAALPSFGVFLLAAIDRFPAREAIPTLAAAWGLVALGGIGFLIGAGLDLAFRATGHLESVWVAPLGIGILWAFALAAQGSFRDAVPIAAFTMALVAPALAVGAGRLETASSRPILMATASAVTILVVLPVRALL